MFELDPFSIEKIRPIVLVPVPKVTAPVPARVRLLNVLVPLMVCVPPFNTTVPALSVKVLLLMKLPLTVSVFAPEITREAPAPIVILLQFVGIPSAAIIG